MDVIPLIIIAIPFVIGVWFWFNMHDSGYTKKQDTKKRKPIPSQQATKIYVAHTKTVADKAVSASKPLYDDEPLKITPLGGGRKAEYSDSQFDLSYLLDRSKKELSKPSSTLSVTTKAINIERQVAPQKIDHYSVIRFVKGMQYVSDGRIYECMGFRGKKDRRVGFEDYGYLEYYPQKRSQDQDYFQWFGIRTDDGTEVCDRGRIRADKLATTQQKEDYAKKIKDINDGERAYWAERKAKRERDAKRLEELERIVKEKGLE